MVTGYWLLALVKYEAKCMNKYWLIVTGAAGYWLLAAAAEDTGC